MTYDFLFRGIVFLNNLAGVYIAIRFLNGVLDRKNKEEYQKKLLFVLFIPLVLLWNLMNNPAVYSNLLLLLFLVLITVIRYKGSIKIKVVISVFILLFSAATKYIAAILFVGLFRLDTVLDTFSYMDRTLILVLTIGVLSKLLLLLLVESIIRFVSSKASQVSIASWLFFITIPAISIYLIIYTVREPILMNQFSNETVLVCFLILSINLIVFRLFDAIIDQIVKNNTYIFLEKQLMIQKKQYKTILTESEKIRSLKHDIINHIASIQGYMENNRYNDANQYMKKLITKMSISNYGIHSGNFVVDAILNYKKETAIQKGIKMTTSILLPETLQIEDIDISILLGNALDNAIEACEKVTASEEKIINVELGFKNENVTFTIVNTFTPDSVREGRKYLLSSKRGWLGYGMGLGNIQNVVDKYGGMLKTEKKEFVFIFCAYIPNKKV